MEFEKVANFRDVGGHTTSDGARVRRGRLYRSGHLAHASDRDVTILGELGIRRVFDFRNEQDIGLDGADRLPEGIEHLRLPMPNPARADDLRALIRETESEKMHSIFGGGRAAQMMIEGAASLVRHRQEVYGLFLRELAHAHSYPALFHCSAGKDRAGWACSVVLLAVGVPEEQIIEQYLMSNAEVEAIRARVSAEFTSPHTELLRPFLEVRAEYIRASFDAIHADYGNVDDYIHDGLGVTEDERQALREHLLE